MSDATTWRKLWFVSGARYRVLRAIHDEHPRSRGPKFAPGETVEFIEAPFNVYHGATGYRFQLVTDGLPGSEPRWLDLYDDESEPDWPHYFERLP